MLEQVVASPLIGRVATLIGRRLGRSLEPFDIWYNGFRAKSRYSEAELDQIVAQRYPTPEAYRDDIPKLLVKLGFAPPMRSGSRPTSWSIPVAAPVMPWVPACARRRRTCERASARAA